MRWEQLRPSQPVGGLGDDAAACSCSRLDLASASRSKARPGSSRAPTRGLPVGALGGEIAADAVNLCLPVEGGPVV